MSRWKELFGFKEEPKEYFFEAEPLPFNPVADIERFIERLPLPPETVVQHVELGNPSQN